MERFTADVADLISARDQHIQPPGFFPALIVVKAVPALRVYLVGVVGSTRPCLKTNL
jgi:hypothetical protein